VWRFGVGVDVGVVWVLKVWMAGLGWVPMPGWPPVFRPALPTMPRWLMMRAGSKRGNKRLEDKNPIDKRVKTRDAKGCNAMIGWCQRCAERS
jgi:hypothetical protein